MYNFLPGPPPPDLTTGGGGGGGVGGHQHLLHSCISLDSQY